jgi:hypothetical protein
MGWDSLLASQEKILLHGVSCLERVWMHTHLRLSVTPWGRMERSLVLEKFLLVITLFCFFTYIICWKRYIVPITKSIFMLQVCCTLLTVWCNTFHVHYTAANQSAATYLLSKNESMFIKSLACVCVFSTNNFWKYMWIFMKFGRQVMPLKKTPTSHF